MNARELYELLRDVDPETDIYIDSFVDEDKLEPIRRVHYEKESNLLILDSDDIPKTSDDSTCLIYSSN